MLTLTKIYKEQIPAGVLERLYEESYDRNTVERERVGDDKIQDELLNGYGSMPIVQYDVDGYIVGFASYHEKLFNGKKYYTQNFCVYGKDKNGSRSWWWSEDFQAKSWEFMKNEGLDGIIAVHNPDSEIGKAALASFNRFSQYYEPPVVVDPEEAKMLVPAAGSGILKAFIIKMVQ